MTEQVFEQEVITAFAWREEELEATFAKIAKIARRLKVEPPTMRVVKRYSKPFRPLVGDKYEVGAIDYVIDGKAPKLEGDWDVIAAIDFMGEAGNIVRVSPRFPEEINGLNSIDSYCEHCNTRRTRKKTVLLQNKDGVRKLVGTTCIKDFVGHNIPAVWDIWEQLEQFENDDFIGSPKWEGNPVALVLAVAFRAVGLFGFVKSDNANSTKDRVGDYFTTRDAAYRRQLQPEEVDAVDAAEAREWIINLDPDGDTYLANLKTAVLAESTIKHIGLIVSLVPAWERAMDRQRNQVIRTDAEDAVEQAPVVEGRGVIEGVVLAAYLKPADYYDARWVMTVLDDRGFKVWGSIPSGINPNVGDRVRFTATVEASDDKFFGFFKRPVKAEVVQLQRVGV